jgi:hypothetical protein
MRRLMLLLAVALSLGIPLVAAAAASPPLRRRPRHCRRGGDPGGLGRCQCTGRQLVQTAAGAMLKDLDAHRSDYRANPGKVHELVDQVLLPHFDTEYSARLVLGKHWTTASEISASASSRRSISRC